MNKLRSVGLFLTLVINGPYLKASSSEKNRAIELKPKINLPIDGFDNEGMTLLMKAVKAGHLEEVTKLINAGANPDVSNAKSQTAFNFVRVPGRSKKEKDELYEALGLKSVLYSVPDSRCKLPANNEN